MKYLMALSYVTIFLCFSAEANVFDKHEKINGVELKSYKEKTVRHYEAAFSRVFPYSLEELKNKLTNFTETCNNSYKNKRTLSKNLDCKYHHEHFIESVIIKEIGTNWVKERNEVERYLLARRLYNRGSYAHYDLVQVFKTKNMKGQKVLTINLQMLEDADVAKLTKPKFEKDTRFDKTSSEFTLTEVDKNQTQLDHKFKAQTDHWILNKQVSVPQVFASISQSINGLISTVGINPPTNTRELASQLTSRPDAAPTRN